MSASTTEILLSSVSSGKTEHILNILIDTLDNKPFTPIWILLASRRQEDAFRQRLANSGRQVFFNVEFFNFYSLYQHILNIAGKPQREISDSTRHSVLRDIIASLHPRLRVFGTIDSTEGFIRIVGDFIYELKQNKIFPDAYTAACRTARDHDLALIYSTYQDYMQRWGLMDKEGEGWLALETLENDLSLGCNIELLLVDGFDYLTPVQANLLGLLTDRTSHSLVTLTTVPKREATIGRRFVEALSHLEKYLNADKCTIGELPVKESKQRKSDLQYLVDNIFIHNVESNVDADNIIFLESPGPSAEVAAVLRHIKRRLLNDEQTAPDDIIIVLRDWDLYRSHFSSLGLKYQIPLVLHYGESLAEHPVINAIFNLLDLHTNQFNRRNLLDVLQSPYFSIPVNRFAGQLDHISQYYKVVEGRENWLSAIRRFGIDQQRFDEEGEEIIAAFDEEDVQTLYNQLESFFDFITPPPLASIYEYVDWLERLIGADQFSDPDEDVIENTNDMSLCVVEMIRKPSAQNNVVIRDMAAMKAFKQVLRSLLDTRSLVESLAGSSNLVDWKTFHRDLVAYVKDAAINPRPGRFGHVLVTTATNARGLPHDHTYILGLSEGIFPKSVGEDPLYLDNERLAIDIPIEPIFERKADDGLFYELICLPRKSITLSRPTMKNGQMWIESPLWRAVKNVFANCYEIIQQNRLKVGDVVPVNAVASYDEAIVSITSDMVLDKNQSLAAYRWFYDTYPMMWEHISTNRQIELRRLFTEKHDSYSGVLQDEQLINVVREMFGSSYVWSATQLNDYGRCGFRFFAKRLLKLEAIEEPESGMDVLQRGTLYHAILEQTYEVLKNQNIAIQPKNVDVAKSILNGVAIDVFKSAPQIIGFKESALWKQEQSIIVRSLMKAIEVDFVESPLKKEFGDNVRQPYFLERSFRTSVDLGNDVGPIMVQGYIDRVDRQDGNGVIIIDYKTGNTPIPITDLEKGRNFQMMVYLLGVQELLKQHSLEVKGGVFWHLGNQKISGAIHLDDDGRAVLASAMEQLANYIAYIRKGDFSVHATELENGRCIRYCEFHQLCRMNVTNRHKQ